MRNPVSLCAAITLAILLTAQSAMAAPPSCVVQNAHYTSMADSHWQAGFRHLPHLKGWVSDLAFYVSSRGSGRTYWFLFDEGSGRYVNLISVADVTKPDWRPPSDQDPTAPRGPISDMMHYYAVDARLTFDPSPPRAGIAAPEYIFLPDLSEVMWYATRAMEREDAPLAFFKLSGC